MTESMSELERTLRQAPGISMILRQQLIRAYQADDGAVQVPALIESHTHLIDAGLLPRLRELAADRSQ